MSIAQLFESGERTQDKGHFKNLVLIANADGIITKEESDLLVRIGKEIGLDQNQMDEIINNPSQFSIIPPVSKLERLEQVVELIKMIQADGEVNEHESKLLQTLALALGFSSIDQVNIKKILELLTKGEDTDTIVELVSK